MASFIKDDPQPGSFYYDFDWAIEGIFFFAILIQLLTDYEDQDQKLVRDYTKILKRYFYNQFIYDLIPIIPFPYFIKLSNGYGRIFYILKVIRLKKGF